MMGREKRANSRERTSRRQFAKSVTAALVTAPLAAASLARAQTPAKPKEAVAPPAPRPVQDAGGGQKLAQVTQAYAEVAHARFGEKLTPEQMEQVRKDMEGNVRTAERLRAVKLKNEDEPDFIFSA